MPFVVAATYRVKEGEEGKVGEILQLMTPLSRQEPGCLLYQAHKSAENPRVFFLYEQYIDEAAYHAHMASSHFQRYIRDEAIPRLESRERALYLTL